VSDIFGFPIQSNKAIVGANAFRHASGIHQDGILKERTTFEIMSAESIGWPSNSLVLGKLSGRAGLKSRLEQLGYKLSKDQLNQTFTQFKLLADRKREITDADLEALMSSQRDAANTLTMYTLDTIQVTCGNHQTPTATISIVDSEGNTNTNTSTGTGPIDAVYKAINSIVNVRNQLTEFRVEAVTEGIDALGGVTVRLEHDGNTYVGRGSDTDIIIASAKAYLNGLNRLLSTTSLEIEN
jgi:2-isopropylmalate synthase